LVQIRPQSFVVIVVTDKQTHTHTHTQTQTNAGTNILPRFRGENKWRQVVGCSIISRV